MSLAEADDFSNGSNASILHAHRVSGRPIADTRAYMANVSRFHILLEQPTFHSFLEPPRPIFIS